MYFAGPAMMVEADLRLKDNIPIMAHDKGDDNNLTFSQWLDEIIKVNMSGPEIISHFSFSTHIKLT